ncbi:MAG: HNH endonuclease, partial [Eubacteriales bacterium]
LRVVFSRPLTGDTMARFPEVYKDPRWDKVRRIIRARDNGLCVLCLAAGKIKPGREVDHIEELTEENKDDPDVAFNPDNLRLLCSDCHNHRHERSIGLQEFLIPPGG